MVLLFLHVRDNRVSSSKWDFLCFTRILCLIIACASKWSDVVHLNNDAAGQHARTVELNSVCQDAC
jgi:hypothetical protein